MQVDLLLINPPFHRRKGGGSMFPLGLGYIISVVEQEGFSYDVVDCTQIIDSFFQEDLDLLSERLISILSQYDPVLVGIGPCMTPEVKALKIIANICISMFGDERLFAGGPLAGIQNQEWIFPEYFGIQYFIRGYGEAAILEALRAKKDHKLLDTCDRISKVGKLFWNPSMPIDMLAFPKRLYIDQTVVAERRKSGEKDAATLSMITSRGCPYHCSYCVSGSTLAQQCFYKRSVKNIVDEMEFLYRTYRVNDIIFYDDCFFHQINFADQEIEEFWSEIMSRGLHMSWQMEVRVDWITHISQTGIRMLEECGCRQINIGIEKTDSRGQQYLGKVFSVRKLREVIHRFKRDSQIKIAGTFILGGGDEDRERVLGEIDQSIALGLDFAQYNPLYIYPGTKIYNQQFHSEKSWLMYILMDTIPWGHIIYENEFLDRDELLDLVQLAYSKFYAGTKFEEDEMVLDRFHIKKAKQA